MLPEGSLRVHAVQLSDAGRYYCTVSNQAGSDHRRVDLRVFGKYSKEKTKKLLYNSGMNFFFPSVGSGQDFNAASLK